MPEVPKIVHERLSHQAAGEHPDANLLSAFAEHALADPVREQVLDHLSRCADCRQIVALTATEVIEERPAAAAARTPAGARPSRWRSPVVHWSALTAAALVVLIAVGARMRLRQGRSASAPAIATSSANEVAQKSIPASEVPVPPAEPKQASKKLTKPPGPPPQAPGGVVGGIIGGAGFGAGTGGGIGAGAGIQNAAPPPPAAIAPQTKMQAKAAASGLASDTGMEQSRQKAPLVPQAAASETVIVTEAAAPPALKSKAAKTSSGNAALVKRWSLSPRWSISDSGVLQRSFDGGRSWKEVAIADGVTFRAVATVGSEVWAGGSGAALFHSADGGEHWSRLQVQANGRTLSGDVVRIEFTDAQNGTVTTSTGETWTTSDTGTTWRSQ